MLYNKFLYNNLICSTWKERLVSLLLEKRIALYSPHTSWDSVRGGVNDWLASCFHIQTSIPVNPGADSDVGSGRLLRLNESIKLSDAVKAVKVHTGLSYVRVAVAKGKSMNAEIQTIALCAGSGASVLKNIAADLYLTGEMLHHDVLDATQKGISVILTNHSDSERGFLKSFAIELFERLENQVQVFVSKCDKDPLLTV
ncbi:hypothetical protein EVAR_54634_1 [Eumeta japonica]|uniref:NIF3-like protein 1 n=1 Tax=Eumeta variegata TaxID=151549 RepID=A0A4C1XA42_EUMVA|nr:hypothetical protein EVAR_54634_1 [Eumeta japonica]